MSRSSAEAEYHAMVVTVSEIQWMRWILQTLNMVQNDPTPLFSDNQAAWHIVNNYVFHERTKYVEMDYYFLRERVELKEIRPASVHTKSQVSDLFTKALGVQQFHFYLTSWAFEIYTLQLEGEYRNRILFIYYSLIFSSYIPFTLLIIRSNLCIPVHI